MRHFLTALSTLSLLLCGCAEDGPTAEDVREHFQRGISGEGQIGPIDRSDDPFVNPQATGPLPP